MVRYTYMHVMCITSLGTLGDQHHGNQDISIDLRDERLRALPHENESFSQVIKRVVKPPFESRVSQGHSGLSIERRGSGCH